MKPLPHIFFTLRSSFFILLFSLFTLCSFAQQDTLDFFDEPYLYKHYNESKKDFRNEFLKWVSDSDCGKKDLKKRLNYDWTPLWLSDYYSEDGIIDTNYWRIKLKIMSMKRDHHNRYLYHVKGKTKLRDTVVNFIGTIRLLYAFEEHWSFDSTGIFEILYTEYNFVQEGSLPGLGSFTGIEHSVCDVDTIRKRMIADTTMEDADGYYNNTFVGVWLNKQSNDTMKCIWSEGRFPFCFNFACGDGEFSPCDAYRQYGWEGYGDDEWIFDKKGHFVQKDKWWLKSK